MKRTLIPILGLLLACSACQDTSSTEFVTTADVYRFWEAYDQIVATDDPSNQRTLLRSLYLDPGSPGLDALRERRGYTEDVYLDAIRSYPQFWASVKENTLRSAEFAEEIEADYERNRPYVTGIREIPAGSMESVDPGLTQLTVEFSAPMSTRFRNQRYGPMGADGVLPVRSLQFSPDKQSIVIGVDLEPGQRYQLQLTDQYRSLDGRVMYPYLIDIRTKK